VTLQLILARISGPQFALFACRGAGKGCDRNTHRKTKAPCQDCFGPLPEDMTIGEVEQRLAKGDT